MRRHAFGRVASSAARPWRARSIFDRQVRWARSSPKSRAASSASSAGEAAPAAAVRAGTAPARTTGRTLWFRAGSIFSLAVPATGAWSSRAMVRGIVLLWALAPAAAVAGPPFLTDDPEPTDPGRWEIYNFVQSAAAYGALAGSAGIDLNYGGAKDLQLTAVLPVGFYNDRGVSLSGLRTGTGMVELAVKAKILHESDGGWVPSVSVFPRLLIPTDRRVGYARTNLFLPIWAQKDFGPWSVFGGGGPELNGGRGGRNFWQGGAAVNRAFGKRLQIGAEIYGQSSDNRVPDGYWAINLAGSYKLVEHWSLLASAGPTWTDGGGHGGVLYLSFKADY